MRCHEGAAGKHSSALDSLGIHGADANRKKAQQNTLGHACSAMGRRH